MLLLGHTSSSFCGTLILGREQLEPTAVTAVTQDYEVSLGSDLVSIAEADV